MCHTVSEEPDNFVPVLHRRTEAWVHCGNAPKRNTPPIWRLQNYRQNKDGIWVVIPSPEKVQRVAFKVSSICCQHPGNCNSILVGKHIELPHSICETCLQAKEAHRCHVFEHQRQPIRYLLFVERSRISVLHQIGDQTRFFGLSWEAHHTHHIQECVGLTVIWKWNPRRWQIHRRLSGKIQLLDQHLLQGIHLT